MCPNCPKFGGVTFCCHEMLSKTLFIFQDFILQLLNLNSYHAVKPRNKRTIYFKLKHNSRALYFLTVYFFNIPGFS